MRADRPTQSGDAGRFTRWARDSDAFEDFYRRHVREVEGFVARRVGDRDRAADLTADVFVAAVEASASYEAKRGSEIGWLFGIARNIVAGQRRRDRRDQALALRISGSALLGQDESYAIDDRLEAERSARELYAAMDHLPDGERAVLELVALDGLSVADASRALGIGAVAGRVRLLRARRTLATALQRAAHGPSPSRQPREVMR
jgi:RNA polymerase sigma factor (sigma-70 family)